MLEQLFTTLFKGEDYPGDIDAAAQIQTEVEVLREQIEIRLPEVEQQIEAFVRVANRVPRTAQYGMAALLTLSTNLTVQRKRDPKASPMRAAAELELAHDTLVGAICDGDIRNLVFPGPTQAGDIELAKAAADVLCWVLLHRHGTEFAKNLARVQAILVASGYVPRTSVDPNQTAS